MACGVLQVAITTTTTTTTTTHLYLLSSPFRPTATATTPPPPPSSSVACVSSSSSATSSPSSLVNLEEQRCSSNESRRRGSARVAAAKRNKGRRGDASIHVGLSGPTTVPLLLPKEEYYALEQHNPVDGFEPPGQQALTLSQFLGVHNSYSNRGEFAALEGLEDDASLSATSSTFQPWNYSSWDSPETVGRQCSEDHSRRGKPQYFHNADEAQSLKNAERALPMREREYLLSEETLELKDYAYDGKLRNNEEKMVSDTQRKPDRRSNGASREGDDLEEEQVHSHEPWMRNTLRYYEEKDPPWNRSYKRKDWAEGEEDENKRGVPAVMRCFDRTKIFVKAGDGGDGVVAFRREKFVPHGGPSGGNGGAGGNVYIEVDASMNSLLSFRKKVHFRAGRGSHGQGKGREGSKGEDCIVKVPPGTLIKAVPTDSSKQIEAVVLLEMTAPGERRMLLPGGRGGRGNAAFKTGYNKAPQLAENGEEGAEMWVELELKLVADVGIIGVPNAGKSTLLSSISSARPNIADYPFTTLLPNLGVVSLDFDACMVVADLPGLLEGAHKGKGLGHEFLRHAERCRVLVHVIDGSSPQPQLEYEAVRLELELFNPSLALKPCVVAFNKMDIPDVSNGWKDFEGYMRSLGITALCISAATKQGTLDLIRVVYNVLKSEGSPSKSCYNSGKEKNDVEVGEMVRQSQNAPLEEFWVTYNEHKRHWHIRGAGLERFTQMTNWEYFEAVKRFQHALDASGVSTSLRSQGIREGETVFVGKMEFTWHDSEDLMTLKDWKRGSRGSKLWPH